MKLHNTVFHIIFMVLLCNVCVFKFLHSAVDYKCGFRSGFGFADMVSMLVNWYRKS